MKKQSKRAKYLEIRKLIRLADKTLSRPVRAYTKKEYGKCPFCKVKPIQVAFHFISRRRYATRWIWKNLIGSCKTCNWWERFFPDRYRAWFLRKYSVLDYLALCDEAEKKIPLSAKELKYVITDSERKLKELGGGLKNA